MQKSGKRLVLLGGNGAVGRDLALAFQQRGVNYDIWEREFYITAGQRFTTGDACVEDIGNALPADGCLWVNLAGLGDAYRCESDPQSAVELNATLAKRYSRLAAAKGQPFLHVSTWEVYGRGHGIVYEGSPCHPASTYAQTKYLGETLTLQSREQGNRVAAIRIGPVIGPNMRHSTALRSFVEATLEERPLYISGDGQQIRQFLDYRDLALAVLTFARSCQWRYPVYNVASARAVSILQLAALVQPKHVIAERAQSLPRPEPSKFAISTERMRQQFGWRAEIPIEDSIDHLRRLWGSKLSLPSRNRLQIDD